ncbi:MAG: hypothetical protein H7832_09650 [Magnetococcus sp. DMHC-6]
MTIGHLTMDQRLQALLQLVKTQQQTRCQEFLDQAQQEVRQVVQQAHREARLRMRRFILEERERQDQVLRSAAAQQATEFRQHRLRATLALLHKGRELLQKELLQRWGNPETRRVWIEYLARQALIFLPAGQWKVDHPEGWDSSEWAPVWQALSKPQSQQTPLFVQDHTLRAGMRISVQGTCVDGTPLGILADSEAVDAMLLAFLEAEVNKP